MTAIAEISSLSEHEQRFEMFKRNTLTYFTLSLGVIFNRYFWTLNFENILLDLHIIKILSQFFLESIELLQKF